VWRPLPSTTTRHFSPADTANHLIVRTFHRALDELTRSTHRLKLREWNIPNKPRTVPFNRNEAHILMKEVHRHHHVKSYSIPPNNALM
jgi:hypothetical protein